MLSKANWVEPIFDISVAKRSTCISNTHGRCLGGCLQTHQSLNLEFERQAKGWLHTHSEESHQSHLSSGRATNRHLFQKFPPHREWKFTVLGKLSRKRMKTHDARWHCKQHQSGFGSIPDWLVEQPRATQNLATSELLLSSGVCGGESKPEISIIHGCPSVCHLLWCPVRNKQIQARGQGAI